jgi:hypothetical protein
MGRYGFVFKAGILRFALITLGISIFKMGSFGKFHIFTFPQRTRGTSRRAARLSGGEKNVGTFFMRRAFWQRGRKSYRSPVPQYFNDFPAKTWKTHFQRNFFYHGWTQSANSIQNSHKISKSPVKTNYVRHYSPESFTTFQGFNWQNY